MIRPARWSDHRASCPGSGIFGWSGNKKTRRKSIPSRFLEVCHSIGCAAQSVLPTETDRAYCRPKSVSRWFHCWSGLWLGPSAERDRICFVASGSSLLKVMKSSADDCASHCSTARHSSATSSAASRASASVLPWMSVPGTPSTSARNASSSADHQDRTVCVWASRWVVLDCWRMSLFPVRSD